MSVKVAKAKIALEFLDKEMGLKRLQLEKQYALVKSEEKAFKEAARTRFTIQRKRKNREHKCQT